MADDKAGVVVLADPLREFATQVFMKHGMPRDEAAIVADHLVEADLRGVYSHGVIRIEPYTARLKAGAMNPRPKITIL